MNCSRVKSDSNVGVRVSVGVLPPHPKASARAGLHEARREANASATCGHALSGCGIEIQKSYRAVQCERSTSKGWFGCLSAQGESGQST